MILIWNKGTRALIFWISREITLYSYSCVQICKPTYARINNLNVTLTCIFNTFGMTLQQVELFHRCSLFYVFWCLCVSYLFQMTVTIILRFDGMLAKLKCFITKNIYIKVLEIQELLTYFLMMTSSNGNIFRVTGPLCGEISGHPWIPRTKASDAELRCFLWSA